MGPRVDTFLEMVVQQSGSDLHLVSGNPPRVRLNGEIQPVKFRVLSSRETQDLLYEIMPARTQEAFEKSGNVDFAYVAPELARFRVNVFRHLNGIGGVFRVIETKIRDLADLYMPTVVKNLCQQTQGLTLVTGPTGSGKTTTLAAMVNFINAERKGHIITIEDPIEYIHDNRNCLMSQREVGNHTDSFADALRSALREDPDVILVGEMRDLETIHMAVTAAEMGILVLGTLHTNSAAATIDRIINVFPPGEESYVRTMLSTSLNGIVSQRLVQRTNGRGRMAAVEILINNTAVANLLREGKTEQLETVLQSGSMQGMQTLDTALRRLLDEELISGEDAYRTASNKSYFEQFRREVVVEAEVPKANEPGQFQL